MNADDPFLLVDRALAPQRPKDLELIMLRTFFDAWERLHAIKGDKRKPEIRKKCEEAAQELVTAADAVRKLKE